MTTALTVYPYKLETPAKVTTIYTCIHTYMRACVRARVCACVCECKLLM